MKKHYMILSLVFLAISGCSLTVQIDTDYASQNRSDGEIQEKVTTESTASPTVDAALEVDGEAI